MYPGAQESVDGKIRLQEPPVEFEKMESPNQFANAANKTENVEAAEECMTQWIKTIEVVCTYGLFVSIAWRLMTYMIFKAAGHTPGRVGRTASDKTVRSVLSSILKVS